MPDCTEDESRFYERATDDAKADLQGCLRQRVAGVGVWVMGRIYRRLPLAIVILLLAAAACRQRGDTECDVIVEALELRHAMRALKGQGVLGAALALGQGLDRCVDTELEESAVLGGDGPLDRRLRSVRMRGSTCG